MPVFHKKTFLGELSDWEQKYGSRCQLPTGWFSVVCIASLDGESVANVAYKQPGFSLGLGTLVNVKRSQWGL